MKTDRSKIVLLDGYSLTILFISLNCLKLSKPITKLEKKLNIKFDCLINNAGTILFKKSFNSMGIEKVFATNHLGPFYLTNSFLKENFINRGGRIINVGSSAHQSAVLDFNNLDSSNSRSWYERYSRSKLCNLLFTLELSKKTSNENIQVNCVHPGIVNTNIAQEHKGILQFIIKLVLNFKGICKSLISLTAPKYELKEVFS